MVSTETSRTPPASIAPRQYSSIASLPRTRGSPGGIRTASSVYRAAAAFASFALRAAAKSRFIRPSSALLADTSACIDSFDPEHAIKASATTNSSMVLIILTPWLPFRVYRQIPIRVISSLSGLQAPNGRFSKYSGRALCSRRKSRIQMAAITASRHSNSLN